jgi:hypothetical protein
MSAAFGRLRRIVGDETGLVLPLVALVLVTLLVFAAFAIDLGAAWAERRTDQAGADAAVMAGAVEMIVGTPTEAGIVDEVRDYVQRNVGLLATSPDWLTCVDPDRGPSYTPLIDSGGNVMDCISIDNSSAVGPGLVLRTKVPDQQVDTYFAPVIGINQLTVDADAEAELLAGAAGEGGIIPFALPQDYSPEECLGTPPGGLIPEDSVCQGPLQGNFGTVDSPHFGAGAPHGTVLNCPPSGVLARTSHQVAIGLDHYIRFSPISPVPPPSNSQPAIGDDDCPEEVLFPYVLNTRTGDPFSGGGGGQWPPVPASPNVAVAVGLVGNGPFGTAGEVGRFRRTGGLNVGAAGDQRVLETNNPPHVAMDNVGLWEYLDPSSSGPCDPSLFTNPNGGTQLTAQMADCLNNGSPEFIDLLLQSPRFALVPLLNYKQCSDPDPLCLTGQSWVHITGLRPVYLQSTWYTCGGPNYCVWETADGFFLQSFNPGEGTVPSCEGIPDDGVTPGSCTGLPNPNQVSLKGVSAFVLEWDYLDDDADPTGNGSPFFAQLYR